MSIPNQKGGKVSAHKLIIFLLLVVTVLVLHAFRD